MQSKEEVARLIDLSALEPGILLDEVEKRCMMAKKVGLLSIGIPALFARKAALMLKDSDVRLSACIGYPYGFQPTEAKLAEILLAIVDGVDDLEVVINYTAVINSDWQYVANEISHILPVIRNAKKTLTVVLEASLLNRGQMIKCCELYSTAEVDCIAASTGKLVVEAGLDDLKFLRTIIPVSIQLKTTVPNLTLAKMQDLILAGVNRVGCNFEAPVLNEINE